jgi:RNA polymerase sigma-70 factor (ECF subfamily)
MTEEPVIAIEELQNGDRKAYADLLDVQAPKIYRLALRMLGNPQEAEDVLQETFLNAFRSIDSFEGRADIGTWLYRIATNQALMRLRKNVPPTISIEEPYPAEGQETYPLQLEDWCCLPEEEFASEEAMQEIESAIHSLSPALRAAFVLRDLHELSTRETADVLGISESAVKTRLLRARLNLRDEISTYFGERLRETSHEEA